MATDEGISPTSQLPRLPVFRLRLQTLQEDLALRHASHGDRLRRRGHELGGKIGVEALDRLDRRRQVRRPSMARGQGEDARDSDVAFTGSRRSKVASLPSLRTTSASRRASVIWR